MAASTQPVFIVGTGRSGTRTFFRMLSGAPGLEIHHEYDVLHTQRIAALHAMGRASDGDVIAHLRASHGAAIHYCTQKLWADSSNKLSWLIRPLAELFPTARFLLVVRDGRKVVPSFFFKLREEMYDDASTACLTDWLAEPDAGPMPPPEKRLWWTIPQVGHPDHDAFRKFDRLQRTAWHWAECNRVVLQAFDEIAPERTLVVKLEEVSKDESVLRETLDFIGTPFDDTYPEYLKTPRNVFFPLDFQLTRTQLDAFWGIARPMMVRLGYDRQEAYHVRY